MYIQGMVQKRLCKPQIYDVFPSLWKVATQIDDVSFSPMHTSWWMYMYTAVLYFLKLGSNRFGAVWDGKSERLQRS